MKTRIISFAGVEPDDPTARIFMMEIPEAVMVACGAHVGEEFDIHASPSGTIVLLMKSFTPPSSKG